MGMSGQLDSGMQIDGATDNTPIGNTGDRLKVDAAFSSVTTTVPSWSRKLRYDDMNASTGGIARDTNVAAASGYVNVYSYAGSGFLAGIILNVETFSDWNFKLLVDGDTVFDVSAVDLTGDTRYDVDDVGDFNQAFLGLSKGSHDRLIWHSPLSSPVYYASSITIQIRRFGGSKKFQSGLVVLSKET